MPNRVTRFFRQKEQASPGILVEDYRNVAHASLIGSVAIGALSMKYGSDISTATAAITAGSSLYANRLMTKIFDDAHKNEPRDEAILHDSDSTTNSVLPRIVDSTGGILLVLLPQIISMYPDLVRNRNLPYVTGVTVGALATAGVLSGGFARMEEPLA